MDEVKNFIISVGKDIGVALIILLIILGSLYAFSGKWPPMVVVESSSMSHDSSTPARSNLGVIDAGDLVIVKDTNGGNIVTYVEGKSRDYKTYGQYGDVIIYKRDGSSVRTPVIHRPVLYLELNESGNQESFDVPSLKNIEYGDDWETSQGKRWWDLTGTITIYDYGYNDNTLTINLNTILNLPDRYINSGFITKGDNPYTNPQVDQAVGISKSPVKGEWVVGKARGELPWLGVIKLAAMGNTEDISMNSWRNLILSLIVIILLPFLIEESIEYYNRTKEERSEEKIKEKNQF